MLLRVEKWKGEDLKESNENLFLLISEEMLLHSIKLIPTFLYPSFTFHMEAGKVEPMQEHLFTFRSAISYYSKITFPFGWQERMEERQGTEIICCWIRYIVVVGWTLDRWFFGFLLINSMGYGFFGLFSKTDIDYGCKQIESFMFLFYSQFIQPTSFSNL